MDGIYQFADVLVKINTMFDYTHCRCEDYRVKNNVFDFEIQTTMQDIDFEKKMASIIGNREGETQNYFDFELEFIAVCRKIADFIPNFDSMFVHGSCISVNSMGFLFIAKSGIGKSTHTRLWRELLGNKAIMVNDDKPILKTENGKVFAFGNPWDGKHHLNNNISVPLKAICLIERSKENEIVRMTDYDAHTFLLQQVFRPSNTELLMKTMLLIDIVIESVDFWKLKCNQNREAAQIAYLAMKG